MGDVENDASESVPDEIPSAAATAEPPEFPGAEPANYPRRWALYRLADETGMSGCGVVAYGVQFPDGSVSYRWNTSPRTSQIAESIHDVKYIHGHEGKTEVRWIDERR